MCRDYYLLTDDQFARMEPDLPTDTRGKPNIHKVSLLMKLQIKVQQCIQSGSQWYEWELISFTSSNSESSN